MAYVLRMEAPVPTRPSWNHLFETAAAQDGLFTTEQGAEAGYSPQLLVHYVRTGRVVRLMRGIYRLVHFPAAEHEDLAAVWLWTRRTGVFSHQTALALHGLSDVLPAQVHVTLPRDWRSRRLRVPAGVVLHHADVPQADCTWTGPVPTTAPRRTLEDCANEHLSPELLRQAARQALQRGLVAKGDLAAVEAELAPFGGIDP
ncbi:MAG: type IV toxin-antitoxin system AbiEi family antitoxin domain-containing protein [Myxococcota bacterium]